MSEKINSISGYTLSKHLLGGFNGGVCASAVNAILFYIGRGFGWTKYFVTPFGQGTEQQITIFPVLFASIIPGLFAGLVLWMMRRFFPRNGAKMFRWLSVVVFVLSLVTPFLSVKDTATTMILLLMHLVASVAIIQSLPR